MGRGRQKAKQTKVARRLKYFSPETDYSALQKELSGSERSGPSHVDALSDDEFDDEDEDAVFEDDEDDDEGDPYWSGSARAR